MEINLPEEIQQIIEKFKQKNYQIYLVGGAVRDFMLGKEIKDFDFTTDATPKQILNLFPDGFYNNQFGTVGISLKQPAGDAEEGSHDHPHEGGRTWETGAAGPAVNQVVEITTMRTEGRYQDSRHPEIVNWTDKIDEDLKRRDFTINAMAYDCQTNQLVDPFNGQSDLQTKIIRAVGDPNKRFQEDALRLLRAIRFATQLNFSIDPQTLTSIQANAQLIENISEERIRDELLKILDTNQPKDGFILLKQSNLLKYILPELENCFGVVQQGPKHDRVYDIGDHSLNALSSCPSPDPIVRFAALIHDIGKTDTYKVSVDGNVTFYHHEVVGAKIAAKICQRLHFSRKETDRIVNLVRWHLFTVDENQTDSAIRRFIKNVGLENIPDMMAIREADRLGGGSTPTSWRTEKFKERIAQVMEKPFSVTDLKVSGKDVMEIMQIPPSRQVGEVLNQLFEEVSQDASKNDREYLTRRLHDFQKLMA